MQQQYCFYSSPTEGKRLSHKGAGASLESDATTNEQVGQVCCVYDGEARRIVLFFCGTCDEGELSRYLKERLPRYMLPAALHQLDTMPLTDNGKLNRRLLLEQATQNDQ